MIKLQGKGKEKGGIKILPPPGGTLRYHATDTGLTKLVMYIINIIYAYSSN